MKEEVILRNWRQKGIFFSWAIPFSTKSILKDKDNVHKHTISCDTIQTVMEDTELYDITNLKAVIIYIGGNDSAGKGNLGQFENDYGQFISTIKSRKPGIQLVLCKLASSGDTDITVVNHIIERLSVCHLVDQYRAFFDRQGKFLM